MRYLEVRRHTMRNKPGKHLSQAGVTLARRVGAGLGRFDQVITSYKPRAFETALAMGYAVDTEIEELGDSKGLPADLDWAASFAEWAHLIHSNEKALQFSRTQAAIWAEIFYDLPDGGRALIVTHGGFIEAGAVGFLPTEDHTSWGASCNYCEGVGLQVEGNWVKLEVLRVK